MKAIYTTTDPLRKSISKNHHLQALIYKIVEDVAQRHYAVAINAVMNNAGKSAPNKDAGEGLFNDHCPHDTLK